MSSEESSCADVGKFCMVRALAREVDRRKHLLVFEPRFTSTRHVQQYRSITLIRQNAQQQSSTEHGGVFCCWWGAAPSDQKTWPPRVCQHTRRHPITHHVQQHKSSTTVALAAAAVDTRKDSSVCVFVVGFPPFYDPPPYRGLGTAPFDAPRLPSLALGAVLCCHVGHTPRTKIQNTHCVHKHTKNISQMLPVPGSQYLGVGV